MKLLIEKTDTLNVVVKGDKHEVITMIVHAMVQYPEAAEAITEACIVFIEHNRPGRIIKPKFD